MNSHTAGAVADPTCHNAVSTTGNSVPCNWRTFSKYMQNK